MTLCDQHAFEAHTWLTSNQDRTGEGRREQEEEASATRNTEDRGERWALKWLDGREEALKRRRERREAVERGANFERLVHLEHGAQRALASGSATTRPLLRAVRPDAGARRASEPWQPEEHHVVSVLLAQAEIKETVSPIRIQMR